MPLSMGLSMLKVAPLLLLDRLLFTQQVSTVLALGSLQRMKEAKVLVLLSAGWGFCKCAGFLGPL